MIFFLGGLGPSFWGSYEMGPVFYTFLHFHLGIRLSTIKRILYGALLAFTTFLFLPFNRLADSSFTILGGVRAFVFWKRLSFVNPGWGWYIYHFGGLCDALSVYLYAFLFFPLFFPCFSLKVGLWAYVGV